MSREEELAQYQEEWRDEVRRRFQYLEELMLLRFGDLEPRVRTIENDKNKTIGALVIVQAIGAIAIWFLNKFTNP